MLDLLLSNKSQTKVLFFLLVNSKCYASQLSQRLKTPLTPLQHTLRKLEKAGVVLSFMEGKNRYFEFNPVYPLITELQALLTKAYIHLAPQEKKIFYSHQFPLSHSKRRKPVSTQKIIKSFWERLISIQSLSFSAKSKSASMTAWNGIGKGQVEVKQLSEHVLVFQENGNWVSLQETSFEFKNVYRWTLHKDGERITLEHLRMGPNYPVHLFELAPIDQHVLESVDAHVCKSDTYFGRARFDGHYIQLHWRVLGPNKNEEIDYLYT